MSKKYYDSNGKEYIGEAKKIIQIIEREYNINWNNKEELTNLTKLYLRSNQIEDITSLKELTNLSVLDLSSNQITDITPLKNLDKLIKLSLYDNKISNISPLKELINLTKLDLMDNQIVDITPLKNLTKLTKLNLYSNQITNINPLKELIELGILIVFRNNPIKEPPLEIVSQGNQAILQYFNDISIQGKAKLNEAKLIIVGEPNAGKSSLMESLIDPTYQLDPNKDTTMGIDVKPWKFSHPIEDDREIRANIWDFGGQEIQYMTHQFFLTSESIYILLTDNNREESNKFDYWFETINLLGKSNNDYSPVIVVKNRKSQKYHFDFDENKYKEIYPHLDIEVREIDLANRQQDFEALKELIIQRIVNLSVVDSDRPAQWESIKVKLDETKKDYIDFKTYQDICQEKSVDNIDSQTNLSIYLHKTGSILHFTQDYHLRNLIILNPKWAVDAVYSVVSNTQIQNNRGRFTQEYLDKILEEYSYDERNNLLALMKKDSFEICYELEDKSFIAPQFLEDKMIEFELAQDTLKFRFRYSFMPYGLINRLIVRLNHLIYNNLVRKRGVVFKDDNNIAKVVQAKNSDGLKVIDISVDGDNLYKKYLLYTIRKEIKSIHNKWFQHIKFEEMIPCNCSECKDSSNPFYFEYSVLEKYYKKNEKIIKCNSSIEDVNVLSLIEGVYTEEEIKGSIVYNIDKYFEKGDSVGDIDIKIDGDVSGVINTGDNNTITQNITTTNNDLENLLNLLKEEAKIVSNKLPPKEKKRFNKELKRFEEDILDGEDKENLEISVDGLLEATSAVGKVALKFNEYLPQIMGMI